MLRQVVDGFFISVFWMFVFCVLVVGPFFWFGPAFETKYLPVVTAFEAVPVLNDASLDPTYGWYILKYEKVRQCEVVPDTFAWYVIGVDDRQSRVDIQNPFAPGKVVANRPLGPAKSNPWQIDDKSKAPFISQIFVLTHRCHPFWLTQTVINIPISSKIYE